MFSSDSSGFGDALAVRDFMEITRRLNSALGEALLCHEVLRELDEDGEPLENKTYGFEQFENLESPSCGFYCPW